MVVIQSKRREPPAATSTRREDSGVLDDDIEPELALLLVRLRSRLLRTGTPELLLDGV